MGLLTDLKKEWEKEFQNGPKNSYKKRSSKASTFFEIEIVRGKKTDFLKL